LLYEFVVRDLRRFSAASLVYKKNERPAKIFDGE